MNAENGSGAVAGYQPWLKRFTLFVAFATVLLIFLGGEVKSREAGLSVPDWPTTYGQNMFLYPVSEWKGPIFYEHFHRLVASGIGMLTIILALWVWLKEPRRWLKVLAGLALLAVILQGILGGMTVRMGLPEWTSVAHGVLAQTFLVLLIILAYGLSKERAERKAQPSEPPAYLRTGAIVFLILLYAQLFVGALVRHTESGLAIPDFPATAGSLVPELGPEGLEWVNNWRAEFFKAHPDSPALGPMPGVPIKPWQMHLHFTHRIGALVIFFALFALTGMAARRKKTHPLVFETMHLLGALLIVQIILGASTIWTARMPLVTSLHVATGAVFLAAAVLLVLRAWPVTHIAEPGTEAS